MHTVDSILEEAAALGIKPAEAMELTMREFGAFARGHVKRLQRARQEWLWTAWHIAAFSRAKKIPELAPLLRKVAETGKRQTPEALLAKARMINMALGGSVKPRSEKVT